MRRRLRGKGWGGFPRWISAAILGIACSMGVALFSGLVQVGRKKAAVAPLTVIGAQPAGPTEALAREEMLQYFSAPDDRSRLTRLHDAGRVKPLWMDYHQRRGHPVPALDEILSATMVRDHDRIMVLYELVLSPGGRQPLAMIWDGDGFGLDWESFTAYGTMDWIEWTETRPEAAQTMRVYVSQIPESLREEAGGQGGRISVEHRDSLSPLPARVASGSGFDPDFTGRQRIPVTAEFRFQRGERGSELVLTRLVHEGWSR